MQTQVQIMKRVSVIFGACLALLFATGCKKETPAPKKRAAARGAKRAPAPRPAGAPGVDAAKKVITIGALNDESGPAAAIGKHYADGKRLAFLVANETKALPKGWTVKLIEKDHHYQPASSVKLYKEIKDKVLFVATSFGTPNTLPLRDMLKQDNMVAFPASLSSEMAKNAHTPPASAGYNIEAMRAMEFAIKKYKSAKRVKAAIIYQDDDYGLDALAGWEAAAKHYKVKLVYKKGFKPGAKDYAAALKAIKRKRANVTLLAVLPSATPAILVTASKLRVRKSIWIGNTPAWVDAFFFVFKGPKAAVLKKFYWANSLPFWGEKVKGMDAFIKAFNKHKAKLKTKRPDFYTLISYIQGQIQIEALRRALAKGPLTRKSFLAALHSMKSWNAGGMIKPINLSKVPYVTTTQARVLQPVVKKATWKVVAPYATPKSYK